MSYFTNNDHKLHFWERGEGPLMLILPGSTAASVHYSGELNYYSKNYHVAALDFWGTGDSERLDVWPDTWWEEAAKDAAALIDHLEKDKAVVMGSSGGGVVALLVAALFPDKVSAVIADSSVAYWPDLEDIVAKRSLNIAEIIRQEGSFAKAWPRIKAIPKMTAFYRIGHGLDAKKIVKADSDFLLRVAEKGIQPLEGQLEKITCPVLLAASKRDDELHDVEGQLKNMAEKIKNARVHLAESGSHPFMWSQPDAFRAAANEFLNSIKS